MRAFIPALIESFRAQTFPPERMEWVVLDDGPDAVGDLFAASGLRNVRYLRQQPSSSLGVKRNRLNEEARGDILVCMDEDCCSFPERVAHVVARFHASPKLNLAGAPETLLLFADTREVWQAGPRGPRHATQGTLAYRRSYAQAHRHDEGGEASRFTDDFSQPMVVLDPYKTSLLLAHGEEQRQRQGGESEVLRRTKMKLKDVVRDGRVRGLYEAACAALAPNRLPPPAAPTASGPEPPD